MKKIFILSLLLCVSVFLYGDQSLRICINAAYLKESPYYGSVCAAFSADGKILATAGDHCNLWDYQSGLLLRTIGFGHHILSISFTHDGKKVILSGAGDAPLKVFDMATGKLLRIYTNDRAMSCRILAVSQDDTYAAAAVYEGGGMMKWWTVILYNINTGESRPIKGDYDSNNFYGGDDGYFCFTKDNELQYIPGGGKKHVRQPRCG